MAVDLETIVKQLADSGIIAPGKLENFVPPKAHPKDAEELARQLVKADHLTPFQGQHVKAGKVKALILGNYTVLDKIGAGGMGQVFKAEHRRMHRIVAIKTLPPAMTKNAATLARFEREVTAAAKLSHPNIVAAYDADEANGAHFLVMEYVEGRDLSAHVKKNGRFSVDKAVNYILQTAKGLEFAHAEGVIHRDIKPANLLFDKKGVVKILDMGLARIDAPGGDVAAQAELTGTGAIMGTVDYMAPEQGVSTKDADARADIYSLGCSLHYLLIGKPVYGGESVGAKLVAHHNQPIPDLCALRDDVPQQVNAIFRKMVAKKVEDRYQTMTEVIADLQVSGMGHDQSLTMQRSISSNLENSALTFLKSIPAATTHKPKPTKKTSSASNGKKKLIYGAVGAGLLGLLVLAGIIVSLRTKDGTLIVEIDQPDAMVQVLDEQGKVEVSQKGGVGKITISVDPGKHRLKVEKDGFTVFGENFEMDSGGKKAITAKLVPVKVVAGAAQPKQPWNTPAFQQWMKTVAAMPAEKQIEAVSKKLMELNPGFGGTVTKRIEGGVVTELKVISPSVVDLSPVRALGRLKVLHYYPDGGIGSRLSNLSPLQGMPLSDLRFHGTSVSDLSALQGMPLTILYFSHTQVSDLSPLKGMPLIELDCHNTRVSDLSPLRGMRLTNLDLGNDGLVSDLSPLEGMPLTRLCSSNTSVSDLSPLRGMSLSYVLFTPKNITKGLDVFRQMGSLTTIGTGGYDKYSPADFWKKYDAGEFGKLAYLDPAFQAWVKTTQALTAEKQIEAVSKKLVELNHGFDGVLTGWGGQNTPRIENGVVTHLRFVTDNVTDISPVRALTGLKFLFCNGSSGRKGRLSDLSPLEGMPLESLYCSANSVSDLSPLTHMKLASLNCQSTQVSDLSPLQGMPTLGSLDVRYTNVTPASMAALQKALPNCKIEWPETGQFFGQLAPGPKPITNVDDPVFQRWMKDVAALPAEKQIEAVRKMLVEFNPGFDGKLAGKDGKGTPKIENNVVTEFAFLSDNVTDISPVRALAGLKVLNCGGSSVGKGKLSNLSSLSGMPLTELDCHKTRVSELSPLRGMRLTFLDVGNDGFVSDLSPLEGMPLKTLSISETSVSDLSRLRGMSLSYFLFTPKNITKGLDVIRQMGSLTTIGTGGYDKWSPIEFWKKYDAGEFGTPAAPANRLADINNSPAFQQWVKATQALPAEKQIEAVARKLEKLNPGFDGKLTGQDGKGSPKIEKDVVTECGCVTDNVTDISPVRALAGLKVLSCYGSASSKGKLSDLSPLEGMPLTVLACYYNPQVSDLSPLRGMPLTSLYCSGTRIANLSPLQGMKLTRLFCNNAKVSDLSPLQGMPLTYLHCGFTQVFDLSPLASMPTLANLSAQSTRITPASVAALQKALPNCKIEWDGSAKTPAASGTK